jgi:8-oxo-dGTP pyrophosphatase MutT (NUDIX family)
VSVLDPSLRERIVAHLAGFDRRSEALGERRHAAVALTLIPGDLGEPAFVLTRRASRLRDHAGQWALPGGRLDPGEGPIEAALRELQEEVGLRLEPPDVLGLLDDYVTRSGFVITPVVVWGGAGGDLDPDPSEVAEVHRVPLAQLDTPEVPNLRRIPESDHPVISVPLLGTHIHAPTAALIFQLREVAIWGRATRVAHFEQPVFAWK